MSESVPRSDDIAASIEATLRREARRNELIIAYTRTGILGVLCLVEVVFFFGGGGVPALWRVPTFLFFFSAVAIVIALRRGWFHPAVGVAVPFLDAALILGRMQSTWSYHSLEIVQDGQELTTVLGGSAVLILTGAFRLRRTAMLSASVLGMGVYLWFALQSQLYPAQVITHTVLLLGIAGMSAGLTIQVQRAVRAEVGRMTLARFLPPTVIDGAHNDPLALLTQPRSVEATVLVSDIRGFTRWSEDKDPIAVLTFLNVIQGALAEIVRQNHGTVDKFMGDGMLAVFGAPESLDDHASRALRAARQMQQTVARINADTEGADVKIGIGVHSGELVVGCLGSGVRMEFTVLGDTVNTASRLESMTKQQGVPVLVSDDTAVAVPDHGLTVVGEVEIRGRKAPMTVWTC